MMATLEIGPAMDLFGTMFQLALWASGFIAIAYVLAVVRVFAQKVKQLNPLKR